MLQCYKKDKNINANISSTNKIQDHELIEIKIKNVNNSKVIGNGAKMFKYRKNMFKREINSIMGKEERHDLDYNVKLLDEILEKTIRKLSVNRTIYEKSIKNK